MLQSITECYRVLQSITEYYRVLQTITEYYRVLLAHPLGPISGLVCYEALQMRSACFFDRYMSSSSESVQNAQVAADNV